MRSAPLSLLIVFLLLTVTSVPVIAATYIVPDDETLIDRADTIVRGTVVSATVHPSADGGLETVYRFAVDDVLKGDVESVVEFREWGGVLDGEWMAASGVPSYRTGGQYLLFLDRFRDGRFTTLETMLGRFEVQERESGTVFVRDLGDSQILGSHGASERDSDAFLSTIRSRVAAMADTGSVRSIIEIKANDLDTRAAASKGASQWSAGSSVAYTISSVPASGTTKGNDQEERILVDDPNDDIAGSFGGSGTIAIAFFGGTTSGFTDRINLTYSDIVVQDGVGTGSGVSQEEYVTVITHELGHTLGIRHANQNQFSQTGSSCAAPLPCSSGAIMNSFVLGGLNGVLQSWDRSALQTSYGTAPNPDYLIVDQSSLRPWYRTNPNVIWRISQGAISCEGPKITAGPVAIPAAIEPGQSAQLSVSAIASKGSLQFQWFRGQRGNTGNPLPGGTISAISVSPSETTTYWVRITDDCGSIDSPAVQVAVSVCEPVITKSPQGKAIGPGESTTLTVEAANATSYTWYVGARGNTSAFAGSGPSLTVTPEQTTSYWVRVGNNCGTVDSASVTVQVLVCPPPSITQQPKDVDIQAGEKATLQVVASGNGSLDYQWYLGEAGDTSRPIGDDRNVIVLENVLEQTAVWVRITGECGFRDSRTARIRIVTVCVPPSVLEEPSSVSIPRGGRAILEVEAAGTSLIYQWVRRAGAISLDVRDGTGPILETEPLDQDRVYFVRVRNNCGSVQSRDAGVTLMDCSIPTVVTQTPSQSLPLATRMTLSIVAAGSDDLTYQWYEGTTGDVSIPVDGANGPDLSVGPLSGSVDYWVRVDSPCGSADSETITLTVEPKRGRTTGRP